MVLQTGDGFVDGQVVLATLLDRIALTARSRCSKMPRQRAIGEAFEVACAHGQRLAVASKPAAVFILRGVGVGRC